MPTDEDQIAGSVVAALRSEFPSAQIEQASYCAPGEVRTITVRPAGDVTAAVFVTIEAVDHVVLQDGSAHLEGAGQSVGERSAWIVQRVSRLLRSTEQA